MSLRTLAAVLTLAGVTGSALAGCTGGTSGAGSAELTERIATTLSADLVGVGGIVCAAVVVESEADQNPGLWGAFVVVESDDEEEVRAAGLLAAERIWDSGAPLLRSASLSAVSRDGRIRLGTPQIGGFPQAGLSPAQATELFGPRPDPLPPVPPEAQERVDCRSVVERAPAPTASPT